MNHHNIWCIRQACRRACYQDAARWAAEHRGGGHGGCRMYSEVRGEPGAGHTLARKICHRGGCIGLKWICNHTTRRLFSYVFYCFCFLFWSLFAPIVTIIFKLHKFKKNIFLFFDTITCSIFIEVCRMVMVLFWLTNQPISLCTPQIHLHLPILQNLHATWMW